MPPPNEAVGLAIFLGGATGGIALGAASDLLFRGDRRRPLLVFTAAQAAALLAFAPLPPPLTLSPPAAIGCTFAACFFALGNYSLLCYGVPTDLGERLAGVAGGCMTCAQYLVSGAGGVTLGALVSRLGFGSWWISLEVATALQFLAILLI